MPRRILTEPKKAFAVRDLTALGHNVRDIAEKTNLPISTINDIILGNNGWNERLKDPSFASYRSQRKRQLQAIASEMSVKLLDHAGLNLETTSPYQAVGMYGILRTHERLDAGEATHNVDLHTKGEVVASEATLAALMVSMGIDSTKQMGYAVPQGESGHSASNEGDTTSNTLDASDTTR